MAGKLWEFKQNNRISVAKADASIASHQAKNARHAVFDLENKNRQANFDMSKHVVTDTRQNRFD